MRLRLRAAKHLFSVGFVLRQPAAPAPLRRRSADPARALRGFGPRRDSGLETRLTAPTFTRSEMKTAPGVPPMVKAQADLFEAPSALPEGFRYQPAIIDAAEERRLAD